LYRVLTGAPPFHAPSPLAVLSKHLTDPVVPPRTRVPERGLPPEADEIVMRAMAKNVEERYSSAAALQRDLEKALARGSRSVVPVGPERASVTAGEAPTVSLPGAELEAGSDPEGSGLQREDLDRFERRLKRNRSLLRLAVPLGIGTIAAAIFGLVRLRAEKAASTEVEPNNTAAYANLLASGRPVRGAIGRALEGGTPDVDYFRVPVGRGARVVSARLEGVPGLDLVPELYDAQGRRLAKSDVHGRGAGEWLQPTSIGPAEAFVAVRAVWLQGQTPAEAPGDAYTLTVSWGPPRTGWEIEPNEWEAAATPVPVGTSVRGYLGDEDDKDWFVVTPGASGRLHVRVAAPDGVDVALLQDAGGKHVTNQAGPGEAEETSFDAIAGAPTLIGVQRKLPRGNLKDADLGGFDSPYEISVQ
jgi:serine/threonine-protein kinase